ncbi:MAG: hypothetical protein OXC19_04185 [Bryobacterales bacterium]|nr:hypothetical protein [Bryobacterales bacterium]
MDVREAVKTAKQYLSDLFSDEELFNVGLEEVDFDGVAWRITLGFSRSWDRKGPLIVAIAESRAERSYKVLRIIDETGTVESLKDRILQTHQ